MVVTMEEEKEREATWTSAKVFHYFFSKVFYIMNEKKRKEKKRKEKKRKEKKY